MWSRADGVVRQLDGRQVPVRQLVLAPILAPSGLAAAAARRSRTLGAVGRAVVGRGRRRWSRQAAGPGRRRRRRGQVASLGDVRVPALAVVLERALDRRQGVDRAPTPRRRRRRRRPVTVLCHQPTSDQRQLLL